MLILNLNLTLTLTPTVNLTLFSCHAFALLQSTANVNPHTLTLTPNLNLTLFFGRLSHSLANLNPQTQS